MRLGPERGLGQNQDRKQVKINIDFDEIFKEIPIISLKYVRRLYSPIYNYNIFQISKILFKI